MKKSVTLLITCITSAAIAYPSNDNAYNYEKSDTHPPVVKIKTKYNGPEVPIAPIVYDDQRLIDINSNSEFDPETIGTFNGKPVSFTYNFDYLEPVIIVGNNPLFHNVALVLENIDSLNNKATFSRACDKITIDFNKNDAFDKLSAFFELPKGWTKNRLTASFDYSNSEIPDPYTDDMRYIVAEPDDSVMSAKLYALINKSINNFDDSDADSLYIPDKKVHDLHSLIQYNIELKALTNPFYGVSIAPAEPNRFCKFLTGYNSTNEIFPIFKNGSIITICRSTWDTYFTGGGSVKYTSYYTYDLNTDHELTFDDIFNTKFNNQIIDIYIDGITNDLHKYEDDLYEENYSFDHYKSPGFAEHHKVAICKQGIIFGYELADFLGFGELPRVTFVIPYNKLKKYMRADFIKRLSLH